MSIDGLPVVQRIFVRAAERMGSAAQLGRHLGLSYEELRPYLYGEAMPPEHVLLRAAEVIVDDLKVLKKTCPEAAWRALGLPPSSRQS